MPQRRIFLLPTRFGLGWAVLVGVLLLFGINYQNSLAYILAFWLFSLGAVSLLRTWRNLLGASLTLRLPREVFAGSEVRLGAALATPRPRPGLMLCVDGGATRVALPSSGEEAILALPACPRGEHPLPLLRLETTWPLGLVRALAWLESRERLPVYPRPAEGESLPYRARGEGLETSDFAGLRRAQPGDSPARLAWKQWSRTGVLAAKVFSVPPRQTLWLDYDACHGDPEQRLSTLCARVLAHHRAGDRYGLRLPGVTLPIGEGDRQRCAALLALARFTPSGAGRGA